ncbi:hypothetical protein GCM10010517_50530 [Streptosporangium fragile]|uniref:HTH araC/xylS-type domain-containing protein n=1 Tax=Streptosporangium fragile TaxID=46186 RepID=A0ABN3W4Y3_9ACTN
MDDSPAFDFSAFGPVRLAGPDLSPDRRWRDAAGYHRPAPTPESSRRRAGRGAEPARRFTARVGAPPMAYLAGWRVAVAADLLREPDATVAPIARQVGTPAPSPRCPIPRPPTSTSGAPATPPGRGPA